MNDSEFAKRFDALAPGAAAKDVAAAFGGPDRKEGGVWTYVRPKTLAVGVQQTIYEIRFDGDRVAQTKMLPGVSMEGAAPVVAAVRADPADKTPIYRIDGKPVSKEAFDKFEHKLGHWGGKEHWSCAETSGGGITRYLRGVRGCTSDRWEPVTGYGARRDIQKKLSWRRYACATRHAGERASWSSHAHTNATGPPSAST